MSRSRAPASCCRSRLRKPSFEAALARMRDPALAETMSRRRHPVWARRPRRCRGSTRRPTSSKADPPISRWPRHRTRPRRPTARRYVPISIIVTTYNRPDALETVLRGLARQSDRDFEVVVADDGSTPDTAALLKSWQGRLQQPLTHVWQEHRGFRAAEIRNRAILRQQRRLLHLPGRRLHSPPPTSCWSTAQLAEVGWFVVGNRVLMSKRLTDRVLQPAPRAGTVDALPTPVARASTATSIGIAPLLQARLGPVRKIRPQYWWGARSCNLAVWRADLDRVDGFDGSYVGWGLEDSDLLIRLLRAGVNRKDGRFSTGVLHLWHPLADPSLLSANQTLLDAIQHSDRIRVRERAVCRCKAAPADGARHAGPAFRQPGSRIAIDRPALSHAR